MLCEVTQQPGTRQELGGGGGGLGRLKPPHPDSKLMLQVCKQSPQKDFQKQERKKKQQLSGYMQCTHTNIKARSVEIYEFGSCYVRQT